MERKTKHRILGVMVIGAFAVLTIPFFEGGSGPLTDAAVTKAPPFPEQPKQVASTTKDTEENPLPIIMAQNNTNDVYNQQPDDTISANSPSMVNVQKPTPPLSPSQIATANPISTGVVSSSKEAVRQSANSEKDIKSKDPASESLISTHETELKQNTSDTGIKDAAANNEDTEEEAAPPKTIKTTAAATKNNDHAISEPKSVKPAHLLKKAVHTISHPFVPEVKPFIPEAKIALVKSASLDADGLARLKDAAWVIQIGSFKNKTNALRLVNQLRASGYRTFIQQVSTGFGEGVRVFVGPEAKQTKARELAAQLESNMHIHGIVISYKPLAL